MHGQTRYFDIHLYMTLEHSTRCTGMRLISVAILIIAVIVDIQIGSLDNRLLWRTDEALQCDNQRHTDVASPVLMSIIRG